jgi:hypothetical protein
MKRILTKIINAIAFVPVTLWLVGYSLWIDIKESLGRK